MSSMPHTPSIRSRSLRDRWLPGMLNPPDSTYSTRWCECTKVKPARQQRHSRDGSRWYGTAATKSERQREGRRGPPSGVADHLAACTIFASQRIAIKRGVSLTVNDDRALSVRPSLETAICSRPDNYIGKTARSWGQRMSPMHDAECRATACVLGSCPTAMTGHDHVAQCHFPTG